MNNKKPNLSREQIREILEHSALRPRKLFVPLSQHYKRTLVEVYKGVEIWKYEARLPEAHDWYGLCFGDDDQEMLCAGDVDISSIRYLIDNLIAIEEDT